MWIKVGLYYSIPTFIKKFEHKSTYFGALVVGVVGDAVVIVSVVVVLAAVDLFLDKRALFVGVVPLKL